MKRYVKKLMPVTAVQWFKDGDHPKVVSYYKIAGFFVRKHYGIPTLEGMMEVKPGDWIVGPGADGEYWPVKDNIFRNTYEEYTDE
jgi:hypothetical protein